MRPAQASSCLLSSPYGDLYALFVQGHPVRLTYFKPRSFDDMPANPSLGAQLQHSIDAYFVKKSMVSCSYEMVGTDFQRRVWKKLTQIPWGTTMTYGELAKQLNTHPRAVGQACRTNPLAILIPCHRVVGKHHLHGYAGYRDQTGLSLKSALLHHEGALLPIPQLSR